MIGNGIQVPPSRHPESRSTARNVESKLLCKDCIGLALGRNVDPTWILVKKLNANYFLVAFLFLLFFLVYLQTSTLSGRGFSTF